MGNNYDELWTLLYSMQHIVIVPVVKHTCIHLSMLQVPSFAFFLALNCFKGFMLVDQRSTHCHRAGLKPCGEHWHWILGPLLPRLGGMQTVPPFGWLPGGSAATSTDTVSNLPIVTIST